MFITLQKHMQQFELKLVTIVNRLFSSSFTFFKEKI